MLIELFFNQPACAQLSPQDAAQLTAIKKELTLTAIQSSQADSLFNTTASELKKYDSEITKVVRSGLPKEETDLKVAVLNQKKKDAREMRDIELSLLLTPDQKKVYDEKIRPAQPAVLHFGMNHDRTSCPVCK